MLEKLAPRERQIVDLLYARGESTVAEVCEVLPDPLTDSAVRAMLIRLLSKGFVRRRSTERGYAYAPALAEADVKRSVLRQLVGTFFGNSPARAASALLGMTDKLTRDELEELQQMIAQAMKDTPK